MSEYPVYMAFEFMPMGVAVRLWLTGLLLASATLAAVVLPLYALRPAVHHSIPDFYAVSREVSLDELLEAAEERNLTLYLPSSLPEGFELTAVYLGEHEHLLAVLVYSAEGDEDYRTAELCVEVSEYAGGYKPPTLEELKASTNLGPGDRVLEVNGWPVVAYAKAYGPDSPEFVRKYGRYTHLVVVYTEECRYMISSPVLTLEELLQLVRSMTPAS